MEKKRWTRAAFSGLCSLVLFALIHMGASALHGEPIANAINAMDAGLILTWGAVAVAIDAIICSKRLPQSN